MNECAEEVTPSRRPLYLTRLIKPERSGRAYAVGVPASPLLVGALPAVDWSDAWSVACPQGPPGDPQQWADAAFHAPPVWVKVLFGLREAAVGLVGIERGGSHAFDIVAWSPDEVLVGIDQQHLSFRASVLLEPRRVVLSTVVQVHNRRGRAYSAVVRRLHPLVVRTMLARAADAMGCQGEAAHERGHRSGGLSGH